MIALSAWVIVLSELPLVPSIILVILILPLLHRGGFVVPSSQGTFTIDRDGSMTLDNNEYQIEKIYWYWSELKLVIDCSGGERFTFWRDSLSVDEYRQLILVLKQWKGSEVEML